MYGKIFASMFDGSMYGNPDAIITLMVMVVLCDKDGNIDMTAEAISARTSIPLEIIQKGISHLEQPDDRSRSKEHDGRRIVPLDPERSWGWSIVNHAKYRKIRTEEERREYWRNYKRSRREKALSTMSTTSPHIPPSTVSSKQYADTSTTTLARSANASSPDPGEIAISFPTNNGHEAHILKSKVAEWEVAYPSVDVPQTLKEARQWCVDNPTRRKTERGMHAFISRWLAREQNR